MGAHRGHQGVTAMGTRRKGEACCGHSQVVAAVAGSSVMFLAASFFPGAAGSSLSFLRRL